MASVNVQEQIATSADQVWRVIADFGGLDKWTDPKLIKSCSADGNEVGAIRTIILPNGAEVHERLEIIDHDRYRMSYTIVDPSPLPVKDYMATAKVTDTGPGTCQVDWQSTFQPIGDIEEAEKVVRRLYIAGVKGLREIVGV